MDRSPTTSAAPERSLRADARRNRERLLAVASDALTATDGPVSLESIARDAGVGIGTLYRHFPTREALIEAVYGTALDELTASADRLRETLPPDQALREWIARYAAFTQTKHGMLETLRAGLTAGNLPTANTRERLTTAVAPMLRDGAQQGTLRADVEADDVVTLLLGLFLATARDTDARRAERLLDLVLDALRPRT